MWTDEIAIPGAPLGFDTPALVFGDNTSRTVHQLLERYGIERALVVTDQGVIDAGIADTITDQLSPEPPRYLAAREPSTDDFDTLPEPSVDGILAIGGGSVIDTAKAISILLTHDGPIADYLGVGTVPGPLPPVVCVPTTSGTGSQATQTAVIAHNDVKRGISDPHLRPALAIVDPLLTVGLPQGVTATSGFDALMHAFESLTARDYRDVPPRPINYQGANPLSARLSWYALHAIHTGLERAVRDGSDGEARRLMSFGSHLAGVAFSNAGLGIIHALASTVGGLTDAPHGACLGASFLAGFSFNRPSRRTEYAWIAKKLGLVKSSSDTESSVDALRDEIDRIRRALDLPGSFADLGLHPGDVETIVENTVRQDRRLATTPRMPNGDLGSTVAEFV